MTIELQALVCRTSRHADLALAFVDRQTLYRLARIEPAAPRRRIAIGFQRSAIARHIRRIADYFQRPFSLLANPLILGIDPSVETSFDVWGTSQAGQLTIHTVGLQPPALVIDGQQRFHALRDADPAMPIPILIMLGVAVDEMRAQFIRINSVHPLAKSLLNSLLPMMPNRPDRLDSQSAAAELAQRLSDDPDSPLAGMIASADDRAPPIALLPLQTGILEALKHGCLDASAGVAQPLHILKSFFTAVTDVYPDAIIDHRPTTSRLLHGTGVRALLRAMSEIAAIAGDDAATFHHYLLALKPHTAWTSGSWPFPSGPRHWNQIQNLHGDLADLSAHLTARLRALHRSDAPLQ